MTANRRYRLINGQPPSSPAMQVVKAIVFTIACALVIVPFVGIIATSLAPPAQVSAAGGLILWPEAIDLSAYRAVLAGGVVTRALGVSGIVTLLGALLSLTVSSMLAYALTRRALPARRALTMLLICSLFFSPGMIPMYLVVKQFGMLDSLAALIVPTCLSAFNVIVLRAFFSNLPQDVLEAAQIDGAGEFGLLGRIVLPLSKAALAVIGLFYAVGYWNSFFTAMLYINDTSLWPLQLVLRSYVANGERVQAADLDSGIVPPQVTLQMAILVISIVPILCVYPFLQRHFAKGALTGAVKG